jgi:hypothetical protein
VIDPIAIAPTWGFVQPNREPWVAEGICSQVDGDSFFPEKGGSANAAKKVCQECPVAVQCLQYALDHDERWGIWGGHSEPERRRLKRGLPVKPVIQSYRKPNGHGYACKCVVCRPRSAA